MNARYEIEQERAKAAKMLENKKRDRDMHSRIVVELDREIPEWEQKVADYDAALAALPPSVQPLE